METALEHLSKEDLIKDISSRDGIIQSLSKDSSAKDEKIEYLESQLAMYKRMQFDQKRERFEGDPKNYAAFRGGSRGLRGTIRRSQRKIGVCVPSSKP